MLEQKTIIDAALAGRITLSKHITKRCRERGIALDDVMNVITKGRIIRQYEDDSPFPSCLINGNRLDGCPCHVVVGYDKTKSDLHLVTTYTPDARQWTENFTRKLKKTIGGCYEV